MVWCGAVWCGIDVVCVLVKLECPHYEGSVVDTAGILFFMGTNFSRAWNVV